MKPFLFLAAVMALSGLFLSGEDQGLSMIAQAHQYSGKYHFQPSCASYTHNETMCEGK